MRAALYARYSAGPRQTDQSIEGQIRECTDYCKKKGFTIVAAYADRHISGKTDERPEFQKLIADSRKNKFDVVVVYKTDRFARNKYDSAIYKRQLRQNGVQIFYAAEAIPDGPEGIILESLMEGLAEYYSAELAQKIRRGMHESALKCRVLGNTMPLGYRASKEHTYEIDPENAKAVEIIFDMYVDRQPNADICRRLNELGFKTSRGNPFNKNSISRIIQNEMYIGIYEAVGVRVENGVPALIPKETFYLAQKERERRKVSKKERAGVAEYMLSGKLFCGYCKKPMAGVSGTGKGGGKFYYYQCPTVRQKGNCQKEHVRRDFIEDLIVQKTVEHVLQPDILTDIAQRLCRLQSESDTREQDIAYYRKKLQENKKAMDNIIKAIEKGLAAETLLQRLDGLESEKIAIEGELAYFQSLKFGLSEEEMLFFLRQFLEPDNDWQAYKRRIINSFINQVFLYNDHFLVYYNIQKDGAMDFSNIELNEGSGFDELSLSSTDALKNACIDPRFKYVTRGCAEYAEWLGQKENPNGKGWAAGAGYGEKILSILKGIPGTAGGTSKPAEAWYRVRKSWADASSQKGAFKSLENAKKCADENPGCSVFDVNGVNIYTPKTTSFSPYLVRVSIPDLNIRKGPGTDHEKTGKYTGIGTFTIVEEADGEGASRWGLLKSYQGRRDGWVSLDYAKRV